ncbi:ATP-grasp domain-containing protein [Actinoplanes sp. TFC3]|uniref:ATP-grasp domain-containing protein n=1 Tax=Actinoplanes sp. TFC3 TaxID=1710355 RepID=UPI000830B796|nr:ATP-grasp domain-containing protein [Actinoplanes sp. TFC3]
MLIFVFPTARQLAAIRRHCAGTSYVVLTHPDVPHGDDTGADLRDVTTTDVSDLLRDLDARILCLHELGIYFVHRELPLGEIGFPHSCLTAVTKVAMADLLQAGGMATAPKRAFRLGEAAGLDVQFPFVVKPDFGFASQLVNRIENAEQWAAYQQVAADPSAWPLRKRYADDFYADIPEVLDGFVIEPDLSPLEFLSVPYVYDGDIAVSFPTRGLRSVATANTSFAWRGFGTPAGLGTDGLAELDKLLTGLSSYLGVRPGVYEVEALWGPEDGLTFLEFSPRPTGGLVPDLVEHAYGVDIDDLAISAFVGTPVAVTRTEAKAFAGLRRGPDDDAPAGRTVVRRERTSAGRVLVDEIIEVAT